MKFTPPRAGEGGGTRGRRSPRLAKTATKSVGKEGLHERKDTRARGARIPPRRWCTRKVFPLFHRRIETLGFSLESDDACGSLLPRDYQRDSWKSDQNKWTAKILPFSPVITSPLSSPPYPCLPPSPPPSSPVAFRIQSFAPAATLLQTDLDSQRLADFPSPRRGGGDNRA